MHFYRFGKTYQLRLETPADLAEVLTLDESLWVATSAPVTAFRGDPAFTALLDADGSGRVHTTEVRAAVKWLLTVLADTSRLGHGRSELPLAAIRSGTPEGEALLASARYVLQKTGASGTDTISLSRVQTFLSELKQRPLNGDGVIVPEAALDDDTSAFIKDVIACTGGAEDASGKRGVTEALVKEFDSALPAYLDWRARGELADGRESSDVMPLGARTPGAYDVLHQHEAEVDLYFELCRALRFEPKAASQVGCDDADLEQFDFTRAEDVAACMRKAPIARPRPDGLLPLSGDEVNPLYEKWLATLQEQVLTQVTGRADERLSPEAWEQVKAAVAPYRAYLENKQGACVEALPLERLQEYRAHSRGSKVMELVASDRKVADVLKAAYELERLLLYHRDLLRFVNNFVSFSELYSMKQRALFEMGSAVLDGRWFNFAVKVDDLAAHTAAAGSSKMFTLYLEVTGRDAGSTFTVAVPATSGAKGNLVAGKRGVFFDVNGKEHDARVVRIIENPISLREALAVPFVRLWGFIVGKIEAMSGSTEKGLVKSTEALLKPQAPASSAGAPAAPAGSAGVLVGLSVSAAAIGSAFAFMTKTFTGMQRSQVLLGFVGAAALVAVPVTLIAVLKLRRQDLSSLLEGCGWAVNARMRLNRAQRRQFTRRMAFPVGSTGTPRYRWLKTTLLLVLLAVALAALVRGVRCWKGRAVCPAAVPTAMEADVEDAAASTAPADDAP